MNSDVASLKKGKLQAPMAFEGYFCRSVFEEWIDKELVPTLEPGDVLIVDNASFHKGGKIARRLQEVGCRLLYLPPYSPELNKIEKYWFPIKHYARKALPQHNYQLMEAISQAFCYLST